MLVKTVDMKTVGMRECRKRGNLTVQGAVTTKKRHRYLRVLATTAEQVSVKTARERQPKQEKD